MWLLGMLMCTKKLYQNLNQFRGTSNRYKSKLYPGSHKLEEEKHYYAFQAENVLCARKPNKR